MNVVQQAPGGSAFFLGEREGRAGRAGAVAATAEWIVVVTVKYMVKNCYL